MFDDIKKVLIITDMDGTYLPSNKIPLSENIKACSEFMKAGGKFSIATGRAIHAASQYFDKVSVNAPIILCNGGMIYDLDKEKSLYDVFLPDFTRDIVKQILDDNPHIGCEILRQDYVWIPQMNDVENEHVKICKVNPKICSLKDIPGNWHKVLFAASPEEIEILSQYVKNKNYSLNRIDFVRSADTYYEILPCNISKGSAINVMRQVCDMKDFTIVAVGDYNNDIEMLQAADLSICPSNAVDEVKAVCDIVLKQSCEENAIAAVIDIVISRLNG